MAVAASSAEGRVHGLLVFHGKKFLYIRGE